MAAYTGQFMAVLDATIVNVAAEGEPDAAGDEGVAGTDGGQEPGPGRGGRGWYR
jgi:hypothetical protein